METQIDCAWKYGTKKYGERSLMKFHKIFSENELGMCNKWETRIKFSQNLEGKMPVWEPVRSHSEHSHEFSGHKRGCGVSWVCSDYKLLKTDYAPVRWNFYRHLCSSEYELISLLLGILDSVNDLLQVSRSIKLSGYWNCWILNSQSQEYGFTDVDQRLIRIILNVTLSCSVTLRRNIRKCT